MRATVCTWIDRDDVFEDYARGTLAADVRDAFETHMFGCQACFDQLQTYRALAAELRVADRPVVEMAPGVQPATWWNWRWAGLAAAAVVVATAVALWPRHPSAPTPAATIATGPVVAPEAPPTVDRPAGAPPQAPSLTPPAAARPRERPAATPATSATTLETLAQVEPPIYLPVALRGLRDEAAERFEAGMQRYTARDYAGAIPELAEATRLKPDAAHATFFLAICRLLTGELTPAAEGLQQVIALGDSPYVEEAHFYLAKARLRQGNVAAAREELQRTIERHGRMESDARRLLEQLK